MDHDGEFNIDDDATPLSQPELSAKLQQAKGELADYARDQGIDLTAPKLTRGQLHDRKLARLEMNVANLERQLEIVS